MFTLDHPATVLADYSRSAASTRVAMVQPACGAGRERSDPYMEWAIRFDQSLRRVDQRIRDWARDGAALVDEGVEPPSREAVARSIEIIERLKVLAMDRVVHSAVPPVDLKGASLGSGGEISLELGWGPFAVTWRIEADGTLTELFFKSNRLIRRDQILR